MINMLIWIVAVVYGYNVWQQYQVLKDTNQGKRIILSLLLPPLNLLKFMVNWVEQSKKSGTNEE